MKIINPLYDKAFKYLMENNKMAKKVLSVILEEDITEVELCQQETTLPDERRGLTLFRLDFKALIKLPDGKQKTILIELQKSKYPTDIQRFRNYLAANYLAKKREGPDSLLVEESKPSGFQSVYPITTIYFLGYNLDDLPYMAVTVNRDVINSVNKEKITVSSFFIEHLTHQSHIIQVRRLPEKRQSRLEKFLVLFNQAWCTEDRFIIDLKNVPNEFSDIAKYLQAPLMDEPFRRQLAAEEELDTIFDAQEAKYLHLIAEALRKEEEAQKLKEEERKLKEEAIHRSRESLLKLARQMKKYGAPVHEIVNETGLSGEEIESL